MQTKFDLKNKVWVSSIAEDQVRGPFYITGIEINLREIRYRLTHSDRGRDDYESRSEIEADLFSSEAEARVFLLKRKRNAVQRDLQKAQEELAQLDGELSKISGSPMLAN